MPLGEVGGRTDCDPASSSLHEGAAPTLEPCGSSSATTAVTPASRGSSTSLRHVPPTRSRTRGGSGSSTPCATSTRSSARRRSAGPRPSSSCSTGTIATAPPIAAELGVPHFVVPDALPDSPFETIRLTRNHAWRETALWWPAARTLVVAEAIGTNEFFAAGGETVGVHLLLRLTPPRDALGRLEPEHLLVGHGRGLHGPAAAAGLRNALEHSRAGLPRLLARVPGFAADAIRRRRTR